MLYVGLACGELVEFLEQRGIPVEVNIMLGSSNNKVVNMGIITVKRFQDRLDKNQLLLMCGDPRYFRFRGFKGIIALYNLFDLNVPQGLGRLTEEMGKDFVNSLDNNAFVFEQSYSLDSAVKETIRIIEDYNHKKNEKNTQ